VHVGYVLTGEYSRVKHLCVGDVHLTRDLSARAGRDLAALLSSDLDSTVVFVGDLLDLAHESQRGAATETIRAIIARHESLRNALAGRLAAGRDVIILAGNHDDVLTTTEGLDAFADALGLDPRDRGRIRVSPWFARLGRDGEIHVEHGHHYDADNALPHPLAPPDPAWWSLGIGLMHRFVAPSGAGALVHENASQPLHLFVRAWELYGQRAPTVIGQYLYAAACQVAGAGRRYPAERARALGEFALVGFADACGLDESVVRQIAARGALPTMLSARETMLRLYCDRALATAVAVTAGSSALVGGPGRRVAFGAAALVVASVLLGGNRYRGRAQRALHAQAEWLETHTAAKSVVFGHIHAPVGHGNYRNTGSFGFPGDSSGRPYVRIDDSGHAEHQFFASSSSGGL